jgi:hypothetical protein
MADRIKNSVRFLFDISSWKGGLESVM